MEFFLDSADVDEIRAAHDLGILDGVTTNPTLVSRAGRDLKDVVQEICRIVPGPVSAEAVSEKADDLIAEGREIAKWAPNVVVKIPLTPEGIKATRQLSREGVKINMTLIFSPLQALLAAKAGATYASPFIGRLDDVGSQGADLIRDIVAIYRNYGFSTKVLAASIRSPVHVLRAALAGAHVATMPFSVLKQLYQHPLTDRGLAAFAADWKALQEKRARV